jgi:serine/threonine protein kinase
MPSGKAGQDCSPWSIEGTMDFLKKLFQKKTKVVKVDIAKRFNLIVRTGQGSMSKVWRAQDTVSGREVALKVLDRNKTLRFESRFSPEANKPSEGEVAVLLNHPNLVNTLEHGITTDNEPFLVMDFVEGFGLSFLVDMQNETMQKHRLNFIVQLAQGIEYFHTEGFIHRDLCPRNVLVDPKGVIKLIDFGLVVPNTPAFQAPGNRTGTASYMAPELIKRQRTDQRLDIFSFAVTCFEMYTKMMPWESGETLEAIMQHINKPPKDIRDLVEGIDEQIASTIMKGLERDPQDRWQTISEMLVQLREAKQRLEPRRKRKRPKTEPPPDVWFDSTEK